MCASAGGQALHSVRPTRCSILRAHNDKLHALQTTCPKTFIEPGPQEWLDRLRTFIGP